MKFNAKVREYIKKLNDKDFLYVFTRLRDRFSGDQGEVLAFLQQSLEMDKLLKTAEGADELYNFLDAIYEQLESESKRRTFDESIGIK